MKKILFLVFVCICSIVIISKGAQAAEPTEAETAAKELASLGLLLGNGQSFALEEPCDRLQGAALFTRLLGKEDEALAISKAHPFLDITAANWAKPYVAYLYNQGLAYGIAYNQYGVGQMRPQQFATFCLRALDYTEGNINSDFIWSEALDFMVKLQIISGQERNRQAALTVFRRGDAVTLAYATLLARMKGSGQTLLQHLLKQGVITAEQAMACTGWPADLFITYPTGALDQSLLIDLAKEQGLCISAHPYEPNPQAEEEIYRQLRLTQHTFDICILSADLVKRLYEENLLSGLKASDFGGPEALITPLKNDPCYDKEQHLYYALPLAYEQYLLYYNNAQIKNPDWSWLFRAAYSGGIYMPADPAKLIPLALHYCKLPYDSDDDKKIQPALKLLSEQASAVTAYLDEHMLNIAEREDAILGVISSRDLPELQRRQEENDVYTKWQAILPPTGAPMRVYYAGIVKNGATKAAANFLKALIQPTNAASHAQLGGYLPAWRGASNFLEGTVKTAFLPGERCLPLHLDETRLVFYEQVQLNALLDEAHKLPQPTIISLKFDFKQDRAVYRSCSIDFAAQEASLSWAGTVDSELLQTIAYKLDTAQAKSCAKDLTRLGIHLWKEYYDGPENGSEWSLDILFDTGEEKICYGNGLPPTWPDVATALLDLCGTELIPLKL
ncbi:MAG: PotD/PotF family extracellular solute-binding protein [Firmicutes bacterium]|nr:PotD/PotF family extracellular solute-binding protein [Bacillota bacterium]